MGNDHYIMIIIYIDIRMMSNDDDEVTILTVGGRHFSVVGLFFRRNVLGETLHVLHLCRFDNSLPALICNFVNSNSLL